MSGRRILVVDDSATDRAALRVAFTRTGLPVDLAFANSAGEALDALRAAGPPTLPHLMLFDIHMPGRSGLDLLAEVKADARWREIPVFLLSGSEDPHDVRAAYRGQACGFVRKPDDFEGLRRLAEVMARLCVETLEFPAPEA